MLYSLLDSDTGSLKSAVHLLLSGVPSSCANFCTIKLIFHEESYQGFLNGDVVMQWRASGWLRQEPAVDCVNRYLHGALRAR